MHYTNPQLYKVAKQQLKILKILALMSKEIDDSEGARIIESAEVTIEHRIKITAMNLNAFEYLERLMEKGHDYTDAEWRTTQCYDIKSEHLQKIVRSSSSIINIKINY